jgi:SAM-dependent methyltransferase
MEIDLTDIASAFRQKHDTRKSQHGVSDRITPSIFQYDYLILDALASDVARLIREIQFEIGGVKPAALDIGCGNSPYRALLESRGLSVKTMDIDNASKPDVIGAVEDTKLPEASLDLILCTQVLEHANRPDLGVQEIFRILRPGGYLIATAPHVWFYHPHPSDNWRFTQEGLTRLVRSAGLEPLRLLSQGGAVLSYFQIMNFLMFGILGHAGAPVYAISNGIGKLGDRLFQNNLFCLNFALLARKPLAIARN